ncbi:MAG: hypothetical protein KDJ80_04900 [Nitratireductor sp.]|nr:hypothetical protein [Nitratireductor sp.]
MRHTSRFTAMVFSAGLTLAGFAMPALAFSDANECNAAVAEATTALLKANVSTDALREIDAIIIGAGEKCLSGDLSGAEADIASAKAKIKAAAN